MLVFLEREVQGWIPFWTKQTLSTGRLIIIRLAFRMHVLKYR